MHWNKNKRSAVIDVYEQVSKAPLRTRLRGWGVSTRSCGRACVWGIVNNVTSVEFVLLISIFFILYRQIITSS